MAFGEADVAGGVNAIQDDYVDDPLRMKPGQRSVAPPTPGTRGDRKESAAPSRSLGQALAGEDSPTMSMTDTVKTKSFGRSLGGVRYPTSVPKPAAPAPAEDVAAPTLPPIDPTKLPDSIAGMRNTVSQPSGSEMMARTQAPPQNMRRADLIQKEAELEKPIDPRTTDASGKQIYRMGNGQRVLQSIGNFLTGFGTKGQGPVTYVGPGATNNRYATDEAMRQGNLRSAQTELGEQEKLDESNRKLFDSATKQAYETEIGAARQGTAAAQQETADTKRMLESSQSELNAAKARKADAEPEPKTETEVALAYQKAVLAKDPKAAVYKATLDQLKALKAAGKDTSAADLAKVIEINEFRLREQDKVNSEMEEERNRRYKEIDADKTIAYNATKKQAAKAAADTELQTKYKPRLDAIEQQATELANQTKTGQKMNVGKGAKPAATPASSSTPKAPPKAGDKIMVDGKERTVVGFNSKTNKPIVAPLGK
jgi:hypothetical protein